MTSCLIKKIEEFIRFLSSLSLAVINLIVLALLSAIGTFIESRYDLEHAQVWIYHAPWMKFALASLSLNLIAVLVHRWPWKKKHTPFISAHFGIVILIIGSIMTQEWGVDGSMRLEVNKMNQSVILPSKIFTVYSSFDGSSIQEMHKSVPQFITNPPSKKDPYVISLGSKKMYITDYHPYASSQIKYIPKEDSGWFVSFSLTGLRAKISESIYKEKKKPYTKNAVGLAHVVLGDHSYKPKEKNEIILIPKDKKTIIYKLVRGFKIRKSGTIRKGHKIDTGWMDLQFQLLDFYPSEKKYNWTPLEYPQENSTSIIQVNFFNQQKWMPLNSFLSFYSKDTVYTAGYMNQRKNIGTQIQLLRFDVEKYQGSSKAKEYKSIVRVGGQKKVVISMNEPLKHNGWTFYQSGFEENESGVVQASILAVNKDPGRWIKYLGSFLIVFGIFGLFYFRKKPS